MFTGAEYLGWTEDALGAISAVVDISIDADDTYGKAEFRRPLKLDEFSETQMYFPPLQFVEIAFNLHVPARVQRSLFEDDVDAELQLGEDFEIRIHDGWQMSLAMIRPIKAQEGADASDAVVMVRRLLQGEFERLKDHRVTFECLGPSPAHFSAELAPASNSQSQAFERASHVREGYDRYRFWCRTPMRSEAEVADAFFFRLNEELDLLYRMAAARVRALRAWQSAVNRIEEILRAYRADGWAAVVGRARQGRKINQALVAIAELELTQLEDKRTFDREFRSVYETGKSGLIREVLADDLDEFEPYPISPLTSLLELLEAGRRTRRDVLIAAMASLIAAAVAALATLIAAG
jgi:hypothetical protein